MIRTGKQADTYVNVHIDQTQLHLRIEILVRLEEWRLLKNVKNCQWVIRVKLFLAFLTFLSSKCISNNLIIKIFWQGRTGLDICSMGAFEAI